MSDLTPNIWFPVVTLVIGALLKATFDFFTDVRKSNSEQEKRLEERRDSARLRHAEFQRETLLELQEVIDKMTRFAHQTFVEDRKAHSETGKWQSTPLSNEVNEGVSISQRRTSILKARAQDDAIRELSAKASILAGSAGLTLGPEPSNEILQELREVVEELNERIGIILRRLDVLESTA